MAVAAVRAAAPCFTEPSGHAARRVAVQHEERQREDPRRRLVRKLLCRQTSSTYMPNTLQKPSI